ncbi:MAG: HEAT repeat domain-containing protein [Myxococcota bacterium]
MRRALLALLALLASGAGAEPRPAAGGVELFRALERAPLAAVAVFGAPTALDGESYAAVATLEVVLRGEGRVGETLELAWEELSPVRPVRFAAGDRVLLAVERLPGASIWRQRIADPQRLARTRSVARSGDAFVRSPALGSVRLLEHFLALPPELRDANPGVAHLIRLAEGAQPVLAGAALDRLAEVPDLDAALDPVSAGRLVAVLLRDPPSLGDAVLRIVARSRPSELREPLRFRAPADGMGPAPVYRALAVLDGSLDAPLTRSLFARHDSPAHRAVAARHADASQRGELARRLRSDGSAEVRAAAVTRLAELDGAAALDRLLFALGDPDLEVRHAAMQAVSGLGATAVPGLREVVDYGTPEAARTAVGALRACGPEGARALRTVANTHPDASVRLLAETALGGSIGHKH